MVRGVKNEAVCQWGSAWGLEKQRFLLKSSYLLRSWWLEILLSKVLLSDWTFNRRVRHVLLREIAGGDAFQILSKSIVVTFLASHLNTHLSVSFIIDVEFPLFQNREVAKRCRSEDKSAIRSTRERWYNDCMNPRRDFIRNVAMCWNINRSKAFAIEPRLAILGLTCIRHRAKPIHFWWKHVSFWVTASRTWIRLMVKHAVHGCLCEHTISLGP